MMSAPCVDSSVMDVTEQKPLLNAVQTQYFKDLDSRLAMPLQRCIQVRRRAHGALVLAMGEHLTAVDKASRIVYPELDQKHVKDKQEQAYAVALRDEFDPSNLTDRQRKTIADEASHYKHWFRMCSAENGDGAEMEDDVKREPNTTRPIIKDFIERHWVLTVWIKIKMYSAAEMAETIIPAWEAEFQRNGAPTHAKAIEKWVGDLMKVDGDQIEQQRDKEESDKMSDDPAFRPKKKSKTPSTKRTLTERKAKTADESSQSAATAPAQQPSPPAPNPVESGMLTDQSILYYSQLLQNSTWVVDNPVLAGQVYYALVQHSSNPAQRLSSGPVDDKQSADVNEWMPAPSSTADLIWVKSFMPRASPIVDWILEHFGNKNKATLQVPDIVKLVQTTLTASRAPLDLDLLKKSSAPRLDASDFDLLTTFFSGTSPNTIYAERRQNVLQVRLDSNPSTDETTLLELCLPPASKLAKNPYSCRITWDNKSKVYIERTRQEGESAIIEQDLGSSLLLQWRKVTVIYDDPNRHRKTMGGRAPEFPRPKRIKFSQTHLPDSERKEPSVPILLKVQGKRKEPDSPHNDDQNGKSAKQPKLESSNSSNSTEQVKVKMEPSQHDVETKRKTVALWTKVSRQAGDAVPAQYGRIIRSSKCAALESLSSPSNGPVLVNSSKNQRLHNLPWSDVLEAYDVADQKQEGGEGGLPKAAYSFESALREATVPPGDARGIAGQKSVVTTSDIPAWRVVARYAGIVCYESEVSHYTGLLSRGDWDRYGYTLSFQPKGKKEGLCISAVNGEHQFGSIAKYINDPRGLKNKKANMVFVEVVRGGFPYLFLVSTAPIEKGDEVLVEYGDAYWKYFNTADQQMMDELQDTLDDAVRGYVPRVPIAIS